MTLFGGRATPASGGRGGKTPKAVYDAALWRRATIDSLLKFDPRTQIRNPVMFVVWLGAIVTAALTINPELFGASDASSAYNGLVTVILLFTVWFANFAEALAECRGKAKAASLRRTRKELTANRLGVSGTTELVIAGALRKGDLVRVERDEPIPADGEVVEGVALVNELAITGESAPVLKQPGTDMLSTVTAGTLLVSDRLVVRVTADPGESFLDRMIHLVEGARRQKTPNELALTALLAILTLIFLIVVSRDGSGRGLFARPHQCRRFGRAAGCAYSDDDRRFVVGYRHCGHRPHVPLQHVGHVRQSGRSGRRCSHAAAGQNRHDHRRRPPSDRIFPAWRAALPTSWFRLPICPPVSTRRRKDARS